MTAIHCQRTDSVAGDKDPAIKWDSDDSSVRPPLWLEMNQASSHTKKDEHVGRGADNLEQGKDSADGKAECKAAVSAFLAFLPLFLEFFRSFLSIPSRSRQGSIACL